MILITFMEFDVIAKNTHIQIIIHTNVKMIRIIVQIFYIVILMNQWWYMYWYPKESQKVFYSEMGECFVDQQH